MNDASLDLMFRDVLSTEECVDGEDGPKSRPLLLGVDGEVGILVLSDAL